MHLLDSLFNSYGNIIYFLIFAIIFAESCIVFFLPGDSLLFAAGIFASQGKMNIAILALGCFLAAVFGNSVGYYIGKKFGVKLFNRKNSFLFSKENLDKTNEFYDKHGKKTIVIARFIPVVRTFAPIIAGIGTMHYKTFVTFNIIGAFLWAVGFTLGGYFLGTSIPQADKYIEPLAVLIVLVSVAPAAIHMLQDKKTREKLLAYLKLGRNK